MKSPELQDQTLKLNISETDLNHLLSQVDNMPHGQQRHSLTAKVSNLTSLYHMEKNPENGTLTEEDVRLFNKIRREIQKEINLFHEQKARENGVVYSRDEFPPEEQS